MSDQVAWAVAIHARLTLLQTATGVTESERGHTKFATSFGYGLLPPAATVLATCAAAYRCMQAGSHKEGGQGRLSCCFV